MEKHNDKVGFLSSIKFHLFIIYFILFAKDWEDILACFKTLHMSNLTMQKLSI